MKRKFYSLFSTLIKYTIIIIMTIIMHKLFTTAPYSLFQTIPLLISFIISFTIVEIIGEIISCIIAIIKIKKTSTYWPLRINEKEQIQISAIHILTTLVWFLIIFLAITTAFHLI